VLASVLTARAFFLKFSSIKSTGAAFPQVDPAASAAQSAETQSAPPPAGLIVCLREGTRAPHAAPGAALGSLLFTVRSYRN
jgi:hypothetical protein